MSSDSHHASTGPAPQCLDANWYPNETRSSFILLLLTLVAGCLALPFRPFVTLGGGVVDFRAPWPKAMSLATFALLSAATLYLDLRRLRLRFHDSLPLSSEPSFHSTVLSRCPEVRGARIRFLITRNPLDTNALTFGVMHNLSVVLGGGLRLLYRRHPELSLAVVDHELGHIRNRDVTIVLVARALIWAYLFLTLFSILYSIGDFAIQWLRYLSGYLRNDQLLTRGVLLNIYPFGSRLVQTLPLAGVSWLMYRRMVQVREYYADASVGNRSALKSILLPVRATTGGSFAAQLKRVFGLHPTAASRLLRITESACWSQYDLSYLFVIGFALSFAVAASIGALTSPSAVGTAKGDPSSISGLFTDLASSTSNILGFASFGALWVVCFWGAVSHCTRVSTFQAHLNRGFIARMISCVLAVTVAAAGYFIGLLLWFYVVLPSAMLSFSYGLVPFPESITVVIFAAVLLLLLLPLVTVGAWLIVRWPTRRFPSSILVTIPAFGAYLICAFVILLMHLFSNGSHMHEESLSVLGVLFELRDKIPLPDLLLNTALYGAIGVTVVSLTFWAARRRQRKPQFSHAMGVKD